MLTNLDEVVIFFKDEPCRTYYNVTVFEDSGDKLVFTLPSGVLRVFYTAYITKYILIPKGVTQDAST